MGKEFDNLNKADKGKKGTFLSAVLGGIAVVGAIANAVNNNAKVGDIDREINDINSKRWKTSSDKMKLNELKEKRNKIRK